MKFSHRIKPSHLRLVVEIADQQKLSLAADRLSIAQPSASRLLSEVEKLLGAPLFTRHPKIMRPTELGQIMVSHARNVLAELRNLELEFDNALQGYSGHVRVGSVTGPACGYVIPALNKVKSTFPKVELTVEIAPSVELVRGLKAGRFDFVIGRVSADQDIREFVFDAAPPETVALCVSRKHPLSSMFKTQLKTLGHFHWVMQERGSPIRRAVEAAFLSARLTPPLSVTNTSSVLAMLSFLVESHAIAPLSLEVYEMLTGGKMGADICRLNTSNAIVVPPAQIIRNASPGLSPVAQRVFDLVRKEFSHAC